MFTVYPWTNRYLDKRENFAKKVSWKITEAVNDLNNIKDNFVDLSKFHANVLHVDSGSFHLLANCIIIELSAQNHGNFNAKVHGIWHKFFAVLVHAITKQYH
ncbi:hemoglobin subunit beta-like [Chiloscyllium plagiosum]|uniref:hemoglobin subunit beta-like n=1 Tax=Chiloscyllium plagiosum TaxID=36176 RepID=UPI001CB88328|nr:hemoglobin subunit beta-like [Chiloscyllium plagiosum]